MRQQLYPVLEGFGTGKPTCLDIHCLPVRLTSQNLNEFTPLLSDLLNSKIYSNN